MVEFIKRLFAKYFYKIQGEEEAASYSYYCFDEVEDKTKGEYNVTRRKSKE